MNIVGVSGGLTAPSTTKALVEFVLKQAVTPLPHVTSLIDVAELALELGVHFGAAGCAARTRNRAEDDRRRQPAGSRHASFQRIIYWSAQTSIGFFDGFALGRRRCDYRRNRPWGLQFVNSGTFLAAPLERAGLLYSAHRGIRARQRLRQPTCSP